MASAVVAKSMQAQSSIASKRVIRVIFTSFQVCLGMSQDPHPFLRMQIFTFQANFNQMNHLVNLAQIRTQIELKEKHRTTRDYVESNCN